MAGLLDDPEKMNQLMQSPLVQMGLSMLANNKGQYAMQNAIGGAGQGFAQSQEFAQQNAMNAMRKQQFDMQNKKFAQEQADYDVTQKAIANIGTNKPEFADLLHIDPKAAMKAIYPTANGADPYFTPISTDQGLGSFDNRKGTFAIVQGSNGNPIIKAVDSPSLQGRIADSKAQGGANWKVNNDVNGVVSTDAQVAAAARGLPSYQGNTPYPTTWNGQAMGAPNTTRTDAINGDGNIQLRDPLQPNRMSSLGISVPTKEAQAAATKSAEMKAIDTTQSSIDLPRTLTQAETTLRLVDELVGSKDGKVKPHKGLDVATGLSSKIDPRNYVAGTDATDFNTRLDQLKGTQFMDAYQSLKGGGQITEVEGKKATDAIARMNTSTSKEAFTKAAREYQDVIRGAVNRSKMKAGLTNKDVAAQASTSSNIRTVDW